MPKIGVGRPIRSQTKEVIVNVKNYFEKEKQNCGPLLPLEQVTRRVSEASGLGLSSVRSICRAEVAAAASGSPFPDETPGKKRPRASLVTKPDSFACEAIRRKVHSFYLKGEIPTVPRLLHHLKEDAIQDKENALRTGADLPQPVFEGCAESLRIVLKRELGFRYKKVDNRKHLLERTDVVALRHSYLRQLRGVADDRTIVYLDETWVNENHSTTSCWQSPKCSGIKKPTGKGKRLILLHAGTKQGFVPNCMLLFSSNSGLADYHKDMNAQVFEEWFENKLLQNIPENSVIIMDNAPYHSVQLDKAPTTKSRKQEMIDWLEANHIPHSTNMLKAELYELIKQKKPSLKRYRIDELSARHGHQVIRLPPYHCQFNPIELIWANIKRKVGERNKTFKLKAVHQLTEAAIDEVTSVEWQKAVSHVDKLRLEYWNNDGLIESVIEPLIISINGDSDESDSDYDDDDDEEDSSSFEDSFMSIE